MAALQYESGNDSLSLLWSQDDNPEHLPCFYIDIPMLGRLCSTLFFLSLLPHGCTPAGSPSSMQLKYKATGKSPEVLAVYEAWFGHPSHIKIDYVSNDPAVIRKQIHEAKAMGISGFVVDWYGDREPFIDQSYSRMQALAGKNKFHVAMMYDEAQAESGVTDEAIADFTMFHDTYLSANAAGRDAYLTYEGRPVIFIFPTGGHTDWDKVRAVVNKWDHPPLLIDENLPGKYADAFDGFYAWVNPGPKGWSPDGSNWGEEYLRNFYETMRSKYTDKIIVGGAWSQFNDSRASWGLNRHIDARCGQTYQDTLHDWKQYFPGNNVIPFMLIATWNDYEEGTAIEHGIPTCSASQPQPTTPATTIVPMSMATSSDKPQ